MSEEPRTIDLSTLLSMMMQGTLDVRGMMPDSSNYTLLAELHCDAITLPVIYKPQRGERPLWDFPHGTLYRREAAAYSVSAHLGFPNVPPTVVRDGPYGIGSVQLFVPSDPEAHLFTMRREGVYEDAIRELAAFDCLINNADRKSGHCLKGTDGNMWAIDHGICFHEENKLRTVVWDYVGETFPDNVRVAFERLSAALEVKDETTAALGELLSRAELRALRQRLSRLLKTGAYPPPGVQPHIPWPPI